MKNVIILGCMKSGKSDLTNLIREQLGYSIVSTDAFVKAFQDRFPDLGINNHIDLLKKDELLSPYIQSYMDSLVGSYSNIYFVVDGGHVMPKTIVPLFDRNNFMIVCLGFPNGDRESLFRNIKKYDTELSDTYHKSDEKLYELIDNQIQYSKVMQEQCKMLNVPYFETDLDRNNILDEIVSFIAKNI